MKTHVDLNPFIVKQNAIKYGNFEVKCRAYNDKEGNIVGYGEETLFTRVYKNKKNLSTISSLTPKGKALFLWIIYSISFYRGFVFLNEKRIKGMAKGLSQNSFKDAIDELGKEQIISVYIHPYYWVNPRFFFLGNRAYAFENYRKPRNLKTDEHGLKEENPDEII